MELNRRKCKLIKFGKDKDMRSYYIHGVVESILASDNEKDLGVLVSNDLKWHNQVNLAVNKAVYYKMLGIIRNGFSILSKKSNVIRSKKFNINSMGVFCVKLFFCHKIKMSQNRRS